MCPLGSCNNVHWQLDNQICTTSVINAGRLIFYLHHYITVLVIDIGFSFWNASSLQTNMNSDLLIKSHKGANNSFKKWHAPQVNTGWFICRLETCISRSHELFLFYANITWRASCAKNRYLSVAHFHSVIFTCQRTLCSSYNMTDKTQDKTLRSSYNVTDKHRTNQEMTLPVTFLCP